MGLESHANFAALFCAISRHIEDIAAESDAEFPVSKAMGQQFGYRSFLCAPMLRQEVDGVESRPRPRVRTAQGVPSRTSR